MSEAVLPGTVVANEAVEPSKAWAEETEDQASTRDTPFLDPAARPTRRSLQVASSAKDYGWTDPDEIKHRINSAKIESEKEYNVFDCYHETGICQWIARHNYFDNATLGVICLNAVYMAVDTDVNKPVPYVSSEGHDLDQAHLVFQLFEHAFCAYFTLEWLIRLGAFANKLNCFCDYWFVFDTLLVSGDDGSSPLGNASALRLLRLLRLSRLVRMLRSMGELMILIKGIVTASMSVFYVMCLQLMLTFVFGITFTMLSVESPDNQNCVEVLVNTTNGMITERQECTSKYEEPIGETFFPNVWHAMFTLLIHATFGDDLAYFMDAIRHQNWPLLIPAIIFISLAQLTLMNMLVGVLCEVVSDVANEEKATRQQDKMEEDMQAMLSSLDENQDDWISYQEFSRLMDKPEALQCLKQQEVNPLQFIDFAETFFFEDGQPVKLSFQEFLDMVLNMRESNTATVKDVWRMWQQMKNSRVKENESFDRKLQEINVKADQLVVQISSQLDAKTSRLEELMSQVSGEVHRLQAQPVSPKESGNRKVTPAVSRLVSKRTDVNYHSKTL
eukprot:TRINITY_DN16618_c0_g1_i1.p1 TRINITY_DN16618_c0_g1~~TRINITY_DN16618_c0_g1_i1.p1  ORF type:complete len:559 (+),score=111.42 TRINITY_DN16618_c0_g1_i1:25-1701(+)